MDSAIHRALNNSLITGDAATVHVSDINSALAVAIKMLSGAVVDRLYRDTVDLYTDGRLWLRLVAA
jgi:hypothetical protein